MKTTTTSHPPRERGLKLDLDATYHRPGAARLAADLGAVLAPDTVAEQVATLPASVAAEVFGTPAAAPDLDGLRLVAEAVRNAKSEEFDMGTWRCGTKACAIGHFCIAHPGDELQLRPVDDSDPREFMLFEPSFGGLTWYDAIASRFRMDRRDACHLFAEHADHERPSAVIARIEQFIRDHTPAASPDPDDYDRAFGDHDSNGTA